MVEDCSGAARMSPEKRIIERGPLRTKPARMAPGRVRAVGCSGAAPPAVRGGARPQGAVVLLDQPEGRCGVEGVHGGSLVGQCAAGWGTQVQSGGRRPRGSLGDLLLRLVTHD